MVGLIQMSVKGRERVGRDLGRRVGRERTEEFLRRAVHLEKLDRLLLEQALGQGMTVRELALVRGEQPMPVRRRLRRLVKVLSDPCFVVTTEHAELVPAEFRRMARAYFVEGLSMRECAGRYGVSLHQVRWMLVVIRGLLSWQKQAG